MRFRWHTQTRMVPSFANANSAWNSRTSVIVVGETAEGAYGVGEATPLPGYSPDSIDEVEHWLRALPSSVWHPDPKLDLETVLDQVTEHLHTATKPPPPSALLAIQTACLDLWSKLRATTLSAEFCQVGSSFNPSTDVVSPMHLQSLSVAPLLDVHSASVAQTAASHWARGHTTFKVKIGIDLTAEVAALELLQSNALASGININFRLDANQSLDPAHVDAALRPFERLAVEYVEEPCLLDALIPEQDLPLPLALDESLRLPQEKLAPWLHPGRVAGIVFKPMVAGDLRSALAWNAHCRRMDCQFVVSHLFDGPIAFQLYRVLARSLAPKGCHGLFPHAGLDAWSDWVHPAEGSGLGVELTPLAQRTVVQHGSATP